MNDLLKKLTEPYEPDAATQYVIDKIKDAMAPFKPGEITIGLRDHIVTWTVDILVKNLPDRRFMHAFDPLKAAVGNEQLYEEIGQRAYEYFSSTPRVTPESNIELGEG